MHVSPPILIISWLATATAASGFVFSAFARPRSNLGRRMFGAFGWIAMCSVPPAVIATSIAVIRGSELTGITLMMFPVAWLAGLGGGAMYAFHPALNAPGVVVSVVLNAVIFLALGTALWDGERKPWHSRSMQLLGLVVLLNALIGFPFVQALALDD